jgi:hypothetical protein
MRRDAFILLLAVGLAMTGPLTLHFYHKSMLLEQDLHSRQLRLSACLTPSLPR